MQYTEPQRLASRAYPGERVLQAVGKTLGGSSTHNLLGYNRGNFRDYNKWENKYGAKGWSFKDVLPFFKKFENNTDMKIVEKNPDYYGTKGPVQITSISITNENLLKLKLFYQSLGFMVTDVNGPNQRGIRKIQAFIRTDGFRSSASNAYVDPNPYTNNLHILTKALVTKILFNGLTAVGVEFAKNDKPFRVYARKEVIISAGAINSPQILMLSGVGPKEHLNKFKIPVVLDLPVGSNYKNHMKIPTAPQTSGASVRAGRLMQIYLGKQEGYRQGGSTTLFFSTKSNSNKEWPNVIIISSLDENGTISFLPFIYRIKSKGSVRLQSTSPYVQPLIEQNAYSGPWDYAGAIEVVSFIFTLKEQPSLSPIISYPSIESVGCPPCPGLKDSQCIEGIKCFVQLKSIPDNHPSGTCRMGAVNRSDVVVDPHLCVKNAKNLRVCDASIMPDIPNANLYAASLMIGEKCAQIIKDYYYLKDLIKN